MVFSIPIDFCIEFWNSTFSPVLEFTEGIFLTASARAFQWCKPRMRSYFRSEVIQVFLAANSTWTYYSFLNPSNADLADFLVALALSSIITDWNTLALNFFQQYSCYLNDIHDG